MINKIRFRSNLRADRSVVTFKRFPALEHSLAQAHSRSQKQRADSCHIAALHRFSSPPGSNSPKITFGCWDTDFTSGAIPFPTVPVNRPVRRTSKWKMKYPFLPSVVINYPCHEIVSGCGPAQIVVLRNRPPASPGSLRSLARFHRGVVE
ncbi:hypothetical protein BDV24DRAFT_25425 [Aspergillus arachidicola]|uniref:Uncharacterized protein n=1 Tax=Aspergillus arachidicola TaxID=656916 RepID=A0A5N6YE76_9EURO|nr:hypothetical protein BDV24DRAFT_25425 [Aspergillus arachidicola]